MELYRDLFNDYLFGDVRCVFVKICQIWALIGRGCSPTTPRHFWVISGEMFLSDKNGKKHENVSGILFGVWTMITKLALALAVGISFSILGLFDFVPQDPNPTSLVVLSLLYGAIPVVFKIISVYLLRDYKDY